jgi:hypothetical protein
LPLIKCSRRIRPIVSTVSIPPPLAWNQSEQRIRPNCRGSILNADPPAQGQNHADDIQRRTGGLLTYVGEWHTHPMGDSDLSDTDKQPRIAFYLLLRI